MGAKKSVASVVSAVTGFLSHHIGDLNAVGDALNEIVGVLPLDSQDKDRIAEVVQTVRDSAANIEKFLSGTTVSEGGVTIKESDIVNALADYLKTDAGKKAFVEAVKNAEGNASA